MGDGRRDRRLRPLRSARNTLDPATVPGAPDGVEGWIGWALDGVGRIGSGAVRAGLPGAGETGKRVLWGSGVWPADMPAPAGSPVRSPGSLVRPDRGTALPFAVSSPGGTLTGSVDQPYQQGFFLRSLTREQARLRIQAAGRTWTLRATGASGVRVVRDDGLAVLRPKTGSFLVAADADELDLTAALLVYSSVPASCYDPIIGGL